VESADRPAGGSVRIACVSVPTALLEAQADGDVVFFVGAGASMAEPTSLPSFRELADRVADMAREPRFHPDGPQTVDVYLGELARNGVPVRASIEQVIREARIGNANHEALAGLVAHSGPVRLVTTNYDDFLVEALVAQDVAVPVFEAPALPQGDDFEGVVYLHGRLADDQLHRQGRTPLVVTDQDLGKAYVTQHWAADFLKAMFGRYTVCFVGFSHDDHLMNYVARGLGSDAGRRYIITDSEDLGRFRSLGLVPVTYPVGQHDQLTVFLREWAYRSAMEPLEKRARIESLRGCPPPQDAATQDFLLECLKDHALAVTVGSVASGADWFRWLTSTEAFEACFGQHDLASGGQGIDPALVDTLAQWYARSLVADNSCAGAGSDLLLHLSADRASIIREYLARNLCSPPSQATTADVDHWLPYLLSSAWILPETLNWLFRIWGDVQIPLTSASKWCLLEYLTTRWVPSTGAARFELGVSGEWGKNLVTGLVHRLSSLDAQDRRRLLEWAPSFFSRVRDWSVATEEFWNGAMAAIPDPPGDASFVPIAIQGIANLLAQTLESESRDNPESAAMVAARWAAHPSPIIRRLAARAMCGFGSMSPHAKTQAVVGGGLLHDPFISGELYDLLKELVPVIGPSDLRCMVAEVLAECEADLKPDSPAARNAYDMLSLLVQTRGSTKGRAGMARAVATLNVVQAHHPDWQPRLTPGQYGITFKSGSVDIRAKMPWSPEAFHSMTLADSKAATQRLLDDANAGHLSGGMFTDYREPGDWRGPGLMVEETVAAHPDDGVLVWNALAAASCSPQDETEVKEAIFAGWRHASFDRPQAVSVVEFLGSAAAAPQRAASASFLASNESQPPSGVALAALPEARSLAHRLLADSTRKSAKDEPPDTSVIESLTYFWTKALNADLAVASSDDTGTNSDATDALAELINAGAEPHPAQLVLLRVVASFVSVDSTWTQDNLIPSISGDHSWPDVLPYWYAILQGRPTIPLLSMEVPAPKGDDGAKKSQPVLWAILRCAEEATGQCDDFQDNLARWLAQIACFCIQEPDTRLDWTTKLTAVCDPAMRARWLHLVGVEMSGADQVICDAIWDTWASTYLRRRVQQQPRAIESAEVAALLPWLMFLQSERFDDLGSLLKQTTCGLPDEYPPIFSDKVKENPASWADVIESLLSHIRPNEQPPLRLGMWITDMVRTLDSCSEVGKEHIRCIRNDAMKLGLPA